MLTRQARSADLTRFMAEAHQPWGWWQHHPGPVTRWQEGERIAGDDGRYRWCCYEPHVASEPSGGSSSAPSVVVRAWGSITRLTGGRKVENTRTSGSSPSTDSRQDDAERWVSWGPRWRWHRLTGRGEQIVTACGAWTWASTPTEMVVGYPGATSCRKCAKKRVSR